MLVISAGLAALLIAGRGRSRPCHYFGGSSPFSISVSSTLEEER